MGCLSLLKLAGEITLIANVQLAILCILKKYINSTWTIPASRVLGHPAIDRRH